MNKCTFRNSGTCLRRTRRRTSPKMHFQEFRDSCAQNKTSDISKGTVRISGNPVRRAKRQKCQTMHFQDFWGSCAQNKTSEIPKNARSGILGLLCAEQNVRNLNKCTLRNSGTPVRKTRRRKYQKLAFRNSGTPVSRTKRRKN